VESVITLFTVDTDRSQHCNRVPTHWLISADSQRRKEKLTCNLVKAARIEDDNGAKAAPDVIKNGTNSSRLNMAKFFGDWIVEE
jgi:hypothetical protein